MPASSDPVGTVSSLTACPLCGGSNECGRVAGLEQCWCMTVPIAPSVVAEIPAGAQDRVCICRACAMRSSAPTPQP